MTFRLLRLLGFNGGLEHQRSRCVLPPTVCQHGVQIVVTPSSEPQTASEGGLQDPITLLIFLKTQSHHMNSAGYRPDCVGADHRGTSGPIMNIVIDGHHQRCVQDAP